MLLGILSDTHSDTQSTAAAVAALAQRHAQMLVHCGDVGSPMVLNELMGMPAAFVWGNCDYGRQDLENHARRLGIRCGGSFLELEIDGKRIAVLHGDNVTMKKELLARQEHDYLLQGHTHVAGEDRCGRIHIINPGALHRARPHTAALLDVPTGRVELLTI